MNVNEETMLVLILTMLGMVTGCNLNGTACENITCSKAAVCCGYVNGCATECCGTVSLYILSVPMLLLMLACCCTCNSYRHRSTVDRSEYLDVRPKQELPPAYSVDEAGNLLV